MNINNKPLKKVKHTNDMSERLTMTSTALNNVDEQIQEVVIATDKNEDITHSKEEAVFNLDDLLLLLDELWPLDEPRIKKLKTK